MENLSPQRFLCAVFLAVFASAALYGCNPPQERSSPTFAVPETLTVEASMGEESRPGTGHLGLDACSTVSTEGGLLLGKGIANDLSYSPDGGWLAVASTTGVHIYKSQEVNEFKLLAGGRSVSRVSFSPNGALIAAGLSSGDICVWRVSDGQPVTALPGRSESRNLSFSLIGSLFSWSEKGEVRGWRIPEGISIETVENIGTTGPVAFSPDGSWVAVGWGDSVRLWRVSDGTFQTFKSPGGETPEYNVLARRRGHRFFWGGKSHLSMEGGRWLSSKKAGIWTIRWSKGPGFLPGWGIACCWSGR